MMLLALGDTHTPKRGGAYEAEWTGYSLDKQSVGLKILRVSALAVKPCFCCTRDFAH